MNEFELIRHYFDRQSSDDSVALGIGDDGAVLTPDPDRQIVTVVDTMVAGVHFPSHIAARDIGYRSVAVNLSDMAAMGARPRWMTLALTLREANTDWLDGFSQGLFEASTEHAVSLVGGDTTRGKDIVVTVQITGDVAPGSALTRAGAKPGDQIYVTGTPGDAAAGLQHLLSDADASEQQYLVNRLCRPTARVTFGQALCGVATAAIDVSDGLLADLSHLASASGVAAELDIDKLPVSDEHLAYGKDGVTQRILAGGDDYELCFAAPASAAADIEALSATLDVSVTSIGRISVGTGISCLRNGMPVDVDLSGFTHF